MPLSSTFNSAGFTHTYISVRHGTVQSFCFNPRGFEPFVISQPLIRETAGSPDSALQDLPTLRPHTHQPTGPALGSPGPRSSPPRSFLAVAPPRPARHRPAPCPDMPVPGVLDQITRTL
ncbi:hypothetical protein E2C01_052133 [Portunus trituberculatus]|uniref:Uncharacterized protein n=1 Tax=Portunus trituberculatus TaxID=210409 RepID=A0A5B7GLJ8_PORTR|nr:hypothetical protein [Portunus trituberculatus]